MCDQVGDYAIIAISKSKDGNMNLLVTVCYLSKSVVAKLLKSKRTHEVIDQLDIIYQTFGTPDIIRHDQSPEFKSKVSNSID